MDISHTLSELKNHPQFIENVGMILVHNGVVRGWSRNEKKKVKYLEVTPDYEKIQSIQEEFEKKPGIFKVIIHSNEGICQPGDDLLYISVSGDIRENVKPVLSDVLEKIKTEAIQKHEEFTS
jgi:molybdopterin synthase catalytic subunit